MERRTQQGRRSRRTAVGLVCVAWALLPGASSPAVAVPDQFAGQPPPAISGDFRYTLSARVRPLLFWVGRDDVGEARVRVATSSDGVREFEILIGSDPRRAPMRVNRWGYLAERVSVEGVTLVGVMTESGEQTLEQARSRASSPDDTCRFKAIRAQIEPGEAHASVLTEILPGAPTYRDVEAVLAQFPPSASRLRRVAIPEGSARGFLSAVADLLDASVRAGARTGRAPARLRRPFVHGTRVYSVVLRAWRAVRAEWPGVGPSSDAIEGAFEVHDESDRAVSQFRITYAIDGPAAGVPLRIVYRPRWWLEAELQLTGSGA